MNGLLLIDKPTDWTSHDVVSKIKRITHQKVGHSGTLDPQATGLLIILVGSATKLTPYLNTHYKTYIASCQLGLKTDTGDIWGQIIEKRNIPNISHVEKVLESFQGFSTQKTPIVSAVKIKGKKLYEYHRENIEVSTPLRKIEVKNIRLLEITNDSFQFEVSVSSGTYIRTLCEDIATRLNTVGTMSSLVRTAIGQFRLEDSISLDNLNPSNWHNYLIPKEKALSHLPKIEVKSEVDILQGKKLVLESSAEEVLIVHNNKALAIYKRENNTNTFRSKRGLW